jgi:hypothetical protein
MMPLGVASPSTPQVRIAGPGQRRRGSGADVPRTFVTRRATRVATIPVGLADGLGMEPASRLLRWGPLLRAMLRRLLRRLGLERRLGLGAGAGGVAFDGREAPVLGRMAMQQTTVDVTALPDVAEGSVAELFLRPTAASARLARVYLRDGVAVRARTHGRRGRPAPTPGGGGAGVRPSPGSCFTLFHPPIQPLFTSEPSFGQEFTISLQGANFR